MLKHWIVFILLLETLVLTGCGQEEIKKDVKLRAIPELKNQNIASREKFNELRTAVIMVQNQVSRLQNSGSNRSWTPTEIVDKLVSFHRRHIQSETKPFILPHNISYVKNRVTKSWQVVLIPKDKELVITIKAYGEDITKPLMEQKVLITKLKKNKS